MANPKSRLVVLGTRDEWTRPAGRKERPVSPGVLRPLDALDPAARVMQKRRVRILRVVSAFVFLSVTALDAALDPASIPTPRPSGWVVDQARVLSADQIAELNRIGDAVRAQRGAEMAIVVVPSIGGGDHREFATRLFNRWEIGGRGQDNGLIIFAAVGDRAAEIILGTGIHGDGQVAMSDRVMQGEMIPRFRSGDNAGAIVAGARACARGFFDVVAEREAAPDPEAVAVEAPARPAPAVAVSDRGAATPPPAPRRRGSGVPWGLGVFLVAVAVVGGGVVMALGGGRPRRCDRCGMTMQALDEAADDQHLSAGEKLEERLGSVDYTIWMCPGCSAIEKVRSGRWFTRYSRCPECGQTTSTEVQSTLRSASELFEGLVEIREHCEHCGRTRVYQRTTPRVVRVSSSSGHSGGGSSSGFGGGRSSGRGSSGKW